MIDSHGEEVSANGEGQEHAEGKEEAEEEEVASSVAASPAQL
jgi:hypothetical protein